MADWPDWRGRSVAIIASGASANKGEVELLKGRLPVVAIKKCVELAPWADAVYGCDAPWWRSVRGLPDFKGHKWAYAAAACDAYGCKAVRIPDPKCDHFLFEEVGVVGGGGNSGFHLTNLVAQLGASRILLIGMDCKNLGKPHWYGRNDWTGGATPSDHNFERWARAFNGAGHMLAERGIEVVNASLQSAITAFPKRSVAETLQAWGLVESEAA